MHAEHVTGQAPHHGQRRCQAWRRHCDTWAWERHGTRASAPASAPLLQPLPWAQNSCWLDSFAEFLPVLLSHLVERPREGVLSSLARHAQGRLASPMGAGLQLAGSQLHADAFPAQEVSELQTVFSAAVDKIRRCNEPITGSQLVPNMVTEEAPDDAALVESASIAGAVESNDIATVHDRGSSASAVRIKNAFASEPRGVRHVIDV
mmetsp:Transcript_55078/g.119968  ORF Transcript_55078/g.119968 Transcript_55078/m.119968 type:complete len:206 (+) Transcript_55078:50-667(+)